MTELVPNVATMKITVVPVDKLVPYARNARRHAPEQVEAIAASIREFGWTNPCLIDGSNSLIAGHGRVLAAQQLGIRSVPCIDLSHLSEQQRRAYVLADNQLPMHAGASWDMDLLRLEVSELKLEGFDVSLLGFGDDLTDLLNPEVTSPDADPDEAPDVPQEPVSKEGDVWVLGPHKVICGSSTDPAVWAKLMGSEMADICWTDPPYGVKYESKLAGSIQNDDLAGAELRAFLLDAFRAVSTVMKGGAAIYVTHADAEGFSFRAAFLEAGFKLSGCLIWRKDSLVLGRSDWQWIHEPCLYGWKPGSSHRWYGGRKQTTVEKWGDIDPVRKTEDGYVIEIGDRIIRLAGDVQIEELVPSVLFEPKPKRSAEHPTMKPVALIERMLKNNARAGDLVVDGFGGSGSTLIAADRLGMSARLVELDPKFVDVIVRRWQNYTGRKAVCASSGQNFPADAQ